MIFSLLFAAAATADMTDEVLKARASVLIAALDEAVPADPAIGTHHGVKVLLGSRCSDICPTYTVRIISYDLAPGEACAAAGGVTKSIIVPMGIAAGPRAYCVPAVLAQAQLYVGHPYQDNLRKRGKAN